MPATEQTWRNLKLLHVVFGLTAIVLLVTTVAMLAADHNRPWKKYQREFRALETWSAESRVQEQDSAAFEKAGRELEKALVEARREQPPRDAIRRFLAEARTIDEDALAADLVEADADRLAGQSDPAQVLVLRGDLLERMRDMVKRTRFREDNAAGRLKLLKAEFDKCRADYELAVAAGAPQERLDALLGTTERKQGEVGEATRENQKANSHRKALEGIVRELTAGEDAAAKALADHRGKLTQLTKTLKDRAPNAGKTLLELPVLDAFNGPLRIDQIWLPQLTLNNNFRDVARFDRCVTCHRGLDKSMPGAPTEPAYREQSDIALSLPAPAERGGAVEGDGNAQLEKLYGFQLAPKGLFREEDPTVGFVVPGSPAAAANLLPGDVIVAIDGGKTLARAAAVRTLVEAAEPGRPLALSVRRGVPQPYATHPRLDLFVGSTSPHPMQTFGCTICHQGQGSATSFKWASHTPDNPVQAHQWHDEHGWFNNHHWILPMLPDRFEQSSCLKCHHQVVDLMPSERFPEPPAPKLVEGWDTIRQYGCYGCHEINGYAGPSKRVGPDMRLAPNYHEVAEALAGDPGVAEMGDDMTRLVGQVRSSPDTREARERLRLAIEADAASGDDAKLSARSHSLAVLLKNPETPGDLPKVGPSLRHVASKDSFEWLYAWLRNPQDFRPSTKMPRFFGLWDHLSGKSLEESQRYEPIEIRSMITYLLGSSAPFEYVEPWAGITAEADAERGKKVVQVRGCLACHQHADFPDAKSTHGPDLSRIGAKVASHPRGKEWLYSWLREPARYHPRTIMPNVLLEPVKQADGTVSDPAADAVAYLAGSTEGWAAEGVPAAGSLTAEESVATQELALLYLKERFPEARAKAVLRDGLTPDMAGIEGDEQMLAGLDETNRDQRLLEYVGKKTIAKLACAGCHDIPGFEDTKPAGAALADWGRKESSKIAFEQVSQFVMHQLSHGGHHGGGATDHAVGADGHGHAAGGAAAGADELNADLAFAAPEEAHVALESLDPDTGFFLEKLLAHEREGFLWQKLRAPRSYDYKKAENKTYNERYRMPQFPFTPQQREAVMTFVLGLVAEPPAPQFVHNPSPREQARLDGIKVAEQYNCGGCHTLHMDRWDVRYRPEALGEAPLPADYPFLAPHFTPAEAAASLVTDRQGLRTTTLVGMPVLKAETGRPQRIDEEGTPVEDDDPEATGISVMLFRDALVDGEPRIVGGPNIPLPDDATRAGTHYPAVGGDLARLLFPVVIADEKEINPNVKPDDAWGWLPPPLVGEGRKVQSPWLHRFLLNPTTIRPAAVLRMPKFNFQSSEAAKLVDYFAAVDGVEPNYAYDPRLDESALAATETGKPGHLDGAMKIVTNNNYCVKCHLVGGYAPPGNPKALAPQLERVHERLRPGYVHDWIANPKRFLPYTGMPVNIAYDKPVSADLYDGTSVQQVDALTDLLMHYDMFAKRAVPVDAYLKQQPAAPAPAATPAAAAVPAGRQAPGGAAVGDAARIDPPDAAGSAGASD
ncbi:MAG: PDZ domain-containing protein [Planctomycetaceae bacterium]